MLIIQRKPKFITFDCYGTLVQWRQALQLAAKLVLSAHQDNDGTKALSHSLAEGIRANALRYQQREPYIPYDIVLRLSLTDALASVGYAATEDDHQNLWSTLSRIAPHPDTRATLEKLRKHFRLAIISNTSDELISGTVAGIGPLFDFVVTAQQAEAYKPNRRLFEYAYNQLGVHKDDTIHVGMGQFTDLKVCHELGIRSVWINRESEDLDPNWTPDAVLPDLIGLPELLL